MESVQLAWDGTWGGEGVELGGDAIFFLAADTWRSVCVSTTHFLASMRGEGDGAAATACSATNATASKKNYLEIVYKYSDRC